MVGICIEKATFLYMSARICTAIMRFRYESYRRRRSWGAAASITRRITGSRWRSEGGRPRLVEEFRQAHHEWMGRSRWPPFEHVAHDDIARATPNGSHRAVIAVDDPVLGDAGADFGRCRSPISLEGDHPFRPKPIARFARSRSAISLEADHSFRFRSSRERPGLRAAGSHRWQYLLPIPYPERDRASREDSHAEGPRGLAPRLGTAA